MISSQSLLIKLGSRLFAACVLGAVLSGAVIAQADEKLGPEILVNGNLKDGNAGWKLETLEGASADLTVDSTAHEGKPAIIVTVGNGKDSKLWTVQLSQADLSIKKDRRYRLTFSAKSDPGKWAFVALSDTAAPYGLLSKGSQIELGDDWKQFTFDLVATKDSDVARLLFTNLNISGAKRYFADISLKEIH